MNAVSACVSGKLIVNTYHNMNLHHHFTHNYMTASDVL